MTVVPLRMVNVSVPALTVPDGLVTVAFKVTVWLTLLKVVEAVAAAVVAAAGLMVKLWLSSV